MRIGIIGPSKLRDKTLILEASRIIAEKGVEIVMTPDKGDFSTGECFALEYSKNNGKKIYEVIPEDDEEFGSGWLNKELGEIINCGTWRNQPEKLNEECDAFLCLGYSAGALIEICYSKWFNKKSVYILKELINSELPKEIEESLDLKYVSLAELKELSF
ncbi:hypothetical protein KAR91_66030 [Candidatus Pacearchaeota archaeon]|nr:hypothetical protein [Candidatus Pacearchaeota archaeon]